MSWERVRAWRDALLARDPADPTDPGAAAAREVWRDALLRVDDATLDRAAAVSGAPYRTATFVAARTVAVAPIEWCALLLGHGTAVRLKHPRGEPGAAPLLAEVAAAVGLPLTVTDDRGAVTGAELVVAMGSDEAMDALRARLSPGSVGLLFGHRFSAAWVDAAGWDGVAAACWPFDGRGCYSPQVVFTPSPLADAVPALAAALARVEARWPRGRVGAGEVARIRARGALARVVGVEARGDRHAVHGLPATHWHPEGLPRCPAVVSVPDRAAAAAVLAPWSRWLSSVGDDGGGAWFPDRPVAVRVCPAAELQRPPVDRVHDGVPVLRAVVRGGW